MKRSIMPLLAALLALAVGATSTNAQTPAPAPALDPVGTFEFSTTVQGGAVNGAFTIAKTDGVLGGKIASDAMPEIVIKSVTVDGKKLTITADMPEGLLSITLEFEDANKFSGSWALGDQGGAITGKRKV